MLTNNNNSLSLFEWLSRTDANVSLFSDRLTPEAIETRNPDMLVSYNYRHIIGKDVLSLIAGRAINLHISLLPWNRGAAPNIFSFLESTPCGVTIHELAPGLDTGDILLQQEMHFDHTVETLKSSYDKLHEQIQSLFKEHWISLKNREIAPQKQRGTGSYHRYRDLEPYSGVIDYNDTIETFLKKSNSAKAMS